MSETNRQKAVMQYREGAHAADRLRHMARFYWGPGHHGYDLMYEAADLIETLASSVLINKLNVNPMEAHHEDE